MYFIKRKKGFQITVFILIIPLLFLGCSTPQPIRGTPTNAQLRKITIQRITHQPERPTATPTASETPTISAMPTSTLSPTPTASPTPSPTTTSDVPQVRVLMQAFCRYGPGKAYLYSHGLYEGDRAVVDGRNPTGTWLWIKPHNLERHCWMAASVAEVRGDVKRVPVDPTLFRQSTLYDPPTNVRARRQGELVVISWDPVWMTEDDDRGYLIEANLCQNGGFFFIAVQTEKPKYSFTDHNNCTGISGGKIYTVEKHGYTDPVTIPWP